MASDVSCDVFIRGYLDVLRRPKGNNSGEAVSHAGPKQIEVAPGNWVAEGTEIPQQALDALIRASGPWGGYVLVEDIETDTGTAQKGRVGAYALYGIHPQQRFRLAANGTLTRERLDRLKERGIFYWSETISPSEWFTLQEHAAATGSRLMTVQQFVQDVLYPWVYWQGALLVGHNLVFDLPCLARFWKAGRWKDGNRSAGGFTLYLCDCDGSILPDGTRRPCFDHPPIRVRHIYRRVNFLRFQHNRVPPKEREGERTPARPLSEDGHFLDTITLGCALREPKHGASLEGLSRAFGLEYQKPPHDFDGPITHGLLTYLQADVGAEWQLYRAERDDYGRHHVRTPITQLYSQASLTKAYTAALGVRSFRELDLTV